MLNHDVERQIANYLLDIRAVELQPNLPFVWASGWKSPIYTDNRKTLSFPEVRNYIKMQFVKVIKENFPEVGLIAGVATGAIAQGALVANEMNLPFAYVRSASKNHGLENLVEGIVRYGQKVVVIEDLVSTGQSSLKAVTALRAQGCKVLGMCSIFTYGFNIAKDSFESAKCQLISLSNYSALIELALETGYVNQNQLPTLLEWRRNPESWGRI